jgi:hypothetical protein
MARVHLKVRLVNNCVRRLMLKGIYTHVFLYPPKIGVTFKTTIKSKFNNFYHKSNSNFERDIDFERMYTRRAQVFLMALLVYKRCIMVAIGINHSPFQLFNSHTRRETKFFSTNIALTSLSNHVAIYMLYSG